MPDTASMSDLFDIERKVVFITGAGGIGKELAIELTNRGAHVFVGDCQKEKLRELRETLNKGLTI